MMHIRFVLIMLFTTLLAACASSVHNPVITNYKTSQYLGGGVAAGAALGAVHTIGNPGGILLGAIIGGYTNSKSELAARIDYAGGQVITIGDTTSILIPSDLFFAPSSDLLKHDIFFKNHPLLNLVTRYLNKFGPSAIKIAVSTDDVDSRPRNYLLAKRQANRVAAYLYREGISAWRLYPMSYGPDNLLATNRTVMGSYHNRMIEITTNPYVTPADCCSHIAHFMAKKQPWQFWGLPYSYNTSFNR